MEMVDALDQASRNPALIVQEGHELLAKHRYDYGSDGPHSLAVLWWKFPPTHWEEL
jgi:hypothetical protein